MSPGRTHGKPFATLSTQFFMNYMVLFLLLVVIGGAAVGGAFLYVYNRLDLSSLNFSIADIYADVEGQGLKEAFLNAGLPSGSYIELIDADLTVIDQYNSIHPLGFRYRQDLFNRILINYFPEYTFYYPDGSDTILLVVTPEFRQSIDFFQMLIITFAVLLLCLVAAVIIYSKVTSVIFLKPVNRLMEGVNRIREGDYGTRIRFNSRNELEQLMEAINLMAERIQQEIELRERAEKNQKRLILDISHDLKTPLTNILGYTENVLASLPEDQAENRRQLEIILNNSTRANTVLRDLFDLARLESGQTEPLMESVDLCEFLRRVAGTYIQELESAGMDYEIEIPDQEWPCLLNPTQMERAIGNLLTNSIKYSGPGTQLRLLAEKQDDDSTAVIVLEDTGPGIEPQDRADVFLPFYRTDASRNSKTGGTGLGLAISRAIVERHRGSLVLDPDYAGGCRFLIRLPLEDR